MAKKPLPTPEQLRQLLRYEPDTGKLFWKERGPQWFTDDKSHSAALRAKIWNARYANQEAMTSADGSYLQGSIFDTKQRAHRVAWAVHYGEWPALFVDHVNCIGTDNRISNLRLATNGQNMSNQGIRADNTSGCKGVSWSRQSQKWDARIKHAGRQECLGKFNSKEEASAAYQEAAKRLHGKFARIE